MIGLRFLLIFAVVVAVLHVPGVQAQNGKMYSYVDENGTVVFTDKKPVDRDVSAQAVPAGPPPTGGNPYAQAAEGQQLSAAEQQRAEISQRSEEARVARAEVQAQCAALQEEVDRLEPHRRVFYTDENGETVRMDDVERTNRVAELKAQIAASCR
jgi:septal ring factor EnvC (AmiA/AmiB activator)